MLFAANLFASTEKTKIKSQKNTRAHTRFTALFPGPYPGEPVPEENFWTLWCKED